MAQMPDESIDCVVTSPPYWNLRDYGVEGQIGNEDTPEDFVKNMVAVFKEIKRILKKDGTVWLNLGDSYASGKSRYSTIPQTFERDFFRIIGPDCLTLSMPLVRSVTKRLLTNALVRREIRFMCIKKHWKDRRHFS